MEIFLNIFLIFCMFAIGSLLGSFFSLATYRIPRHQDIVATRSYCPKCKHRLEFFDLIPVLSFIFRGGKCKYCGDKISIRYPLLELSNGVIFVIFYLIFGYNLNLLFIGIIYAVCFVLVGSFIMKNKMSDEEKKEVSNLHLSSKKGVFILELVVALIVFTVFIVSALIIMRNSTNKSANTIARSNAVSIAVKNIETALSKDYENLFSTQSSETVDNIVYSVTTNVTKYSDMDTSKRDIVKIIEVNVKYMCNGNAYDFSLRTLKGKVL